MDLVIPGKNKVYKYRNLTMFADGGIINVFNENEKYKDKPFIQLTISDMKPRVLAMMEHLQALGRDASISGRAKDEYNDAKDCVEKVVAVMTDALNQGNPEDPRVMKSMLNDYKTSAKHKYTFVNFDKKAKCLQ